MALATFPRWHWHESPGRYTAAGDYTDIDVPSRWKWSAESWKQLLNFASSLKWRESENHEVAFIELTFLFHLRGFRCPDFDCDITTFRDLHQLVRQGLRQIQKTRPFPGCWLENNNKSWGRHLPTGVIRNAMPWFSFQELELLANTLLNGAGGQISTWSFPLADCTKF